MLNKTKSKKVAILKYGLSAPLFVGMLIVSSISLDAKALTIPQQVENLNEQLEIRRPEITKELRLINQKTALQASVANPEEAPKAKTIKATESLIQEKIQTPTDTGIYDQSHLDKQPEFPGGIDKLREFLGKNYKYPSMATDLKVSGRIIIEFIVEKNGELSNIKVLRDLGFGTGEEAKRVIQQSPKWLPGMKNGTAVRANYVIPFAIQSPGNTHDPFKSQYILDGNKVTYSDLVSIGLKRIESLEIIKDKEKIREFNVEPRIEAVVIIKLKKN